MYITAGGSTCALEEVKAEVTASDALTETSTAQALSSH
jgi:hypothetical protein